MKLHLSLALLPLFNKAQLDLTVFDQRQCYSWFFSFTQDTDRKISSFWLNAIWSEAGWYISWTTLCRDNVYRGVRMYTEVYKKNCELSEQTFTQENDNSMSVEIYHALKNVHLMVHWIWKQNNLLVTLWNKTVKEETLLKF